MVTKVFALTAGLSALALFTQVFSSIGDAFVVKAEGAIGVATVCIRLAGWFNALAFGSAFGSYGIFAIGVRAALYRLVLALAVFALFLAVTTVFVFGA